jgi:hypothetical protein
MDPFIVCLFSLMNEFQPAIEPRQTERRLATADKRSISNPLEAEPIRAEKTGDEGKFMICIMVLRAMECRAH